MHKQVSMHVFKSHCFKMLDRGFENTAIFLHKGQKGGRYFGVMKTNTAEIERLNSLLLYGISVSALDKRSRIIYT